MNPECTVLFCRNGDHCSHSALGVPDNWRRGPTLQERVRAEVHERIGRERAPRYSDRTSLPYAEAVLNEVHRFASIVPTSTAHRPTRDVELRGFLIPENSTVYPNLCALMKLSSSSSLSLRDSSFLRKGSASYAYGKLTASLFSKAP